jgi:hypothetical protein
MFYLSAAGKIDTNERKGLQFGILGIWDTEQMVPQSATQHPKVLRIDNHDSHKKSTADRELSAHHTERRTTLSEKLRHGNRFPIWVNRLPNILNT